MPEFASSVKVGLVVDYYEPQTELRLAICRGPACFLAYIGVPRGHRIAGESSLDFPCRWGVTFSGYSTPLLPANFYWWGWDYGHAGDFMEFSEIPENLLPMNSTAQRISLEEVRTDAFAIFEKFKEALVLAQATVAPLKDRSLLSRLLP